MYGIQLIEWNPNGHDGSYENINYFHVKHGYGFFAKPDFITNCIVDRGANDDFGKEKRSEFGSEEITISAINEMIKEGTPPDFGDLENCNLNINGYTLSDINFGNRVLLTNGLAGSIRFIGKVDFDDNIWFGIDLKKKNCNANNGIVGGRKYFEPKEHCGYFIKINEIERILPSKSQKQKNKKLKKKNKKRKCLKNFPKLGDRVKTINNRTGIVEFIGVICLVKDVCIGLTLDKMYKYGNDGSVKGKRYFNCDIGRGYFVRLQHLIQNMGNIKDNNIENIGNIGNIGYYYDDDEVVDNNDDEKDEKVSSVILEQGFYRIREKLKEIEMLEERHKNGFFLFPTQFKKMAKRKQYEMALNEIKNGSWNHANNKKIDENKENEEDEEDDDMKMKEAQVENEENEDNEEDNNDPFDVLDNLLDIGYKMVENDGNILNNNKF